jgi:hypothetical protein
LELDNIPNVLTAEQLITLGEEILTRYANPNSESTTIIAIGKTEPEKELVKYFKKVCRQDGLEMRTEIFKLLEHVWKGQWHKPPGNPQLNIGRYLTDQKINSEVKCDEPNCTEKAKWNCTTIYPYRTVRNLCVGHERKMRVRRELKEDKTKLLSKCPAVEELKE